MDGAILKQCGRAFVPYVKESIFRLPPEEQRWVRGKVRFTQRHRQQALVDEYMRRGMADAAAALTKVIDLPPAATWKHARYHYIRLHPRVLLYAVREEILFTVAHEIAHCFLWLPIGKREWFSDLEWEQKADAWAWERGFTTELGFVTGEDTAAYAWAQDKVMREWDDAIGAWVKEEWHAT
jgi:hypothetical protein